MEKLKPHAQQALDEPEGSSLFLHLQVAEGKVQRLEVGSKPRPLENQPRKERQVNWYREPLVHFVAIGALLFGIYLWLNDPYATSNSTRIEVSANDIELLHARWMKQWQRPPTAEELRGLVEDHIREEVLYREALALGLDKDDTIVRRRMALKMEFLVADVAVPTAPDQVELRGYFQENQERYRQPVTLSFTHIYFNPDRRGSSTQRDAEAELDRLQAAKQRPRRARDLGDRFMLAHEYVEKSTPDIARDFGGAFAQRLIELEPGRWHGPVASGYGLHLVYISDRAESRLPDFAAVRDKVENDFLIDKRREANELAYQRLRERYEIVVAPLEGKKWMASKNEK